MGSVRLAVCLVLLVGGVANARVGGGHHYSSPSRSSPTHSSSGGTHSRPPSWSSLPSGPASHNGYYGGPSPFFHLVLDPTVLLSLIVLVIVILVLMRRAFGAAAVTQRALAEQDAIARLDVTEADRRAWAAALQKRDSGFSTTAFLERVRALFLAAQQAWSLGDLTSVRRFLSDATWLRFRVQLGLLQAQGVRNVTTAVEVTGMELVGFEQNDWFDTLHVAVHARARDVDVPADWPTSKVEAAAARAESQPFIEVWSLVRKPGVQSNAQSALAAQSCPSCGAPFEGGATSTCSYCKAVVNSGGYDWVLAEITQAVEAQRSDLAVPGLAAIRQHDPALSLEVLEDRASLIFWRWVEAQSAAQPDRLARLAQPTAVERLRDDVERLSQQKARRVFLECAVGGVRVLSFEESPDGRTVAHIEIRWSARTGVGPSGEAPPQLPTVPQRWVFTLVRASVSTSRADQGMSTDRCPECGGPLGDGLDTKCQWCGVVLAGNLKDWTLAEACPVEAWQARPQSAESPMASIVPEFPNFEERERLLYVMAAMANADGVVDSRERRLLLQCAQRWGLPAQEVDAALSAGAPIETLLPGTAAGEPFLRALAQLARVDGKVDAAERRMLEVVAFRLGLAQRLPAVLASVGAS